MYMYHEVFKGKFQGTYAYTVVPLLSELIGLYNIALENRVSKAINLYSDYTENKFQLLNICTITSVYCIRFGLKCLP